jgi:putative FmdB family regulatory protein
MPTYEYRCEHCGSEFERFGRMSDPPVETCPSCGKEAARKLSAGAGLLFRGSGFYITDNRGEGYRKAAESDRAGGEVKPETPPGPKEGAKPAPGPPKPAPGPGPAAPGGGKGE